MFCPTMGSEEKLKWRLISHIKLKNPGVIGLSLVLSAFWTKFSESDKRACSSRAKIADEPWSQILHTSHFLIIISTLGCRNQDIH